MAEVTADGWLGDLLSGAEDRTLEPTPTPDGFVGELRPYQERGLGWLTFLGDLGLGACLADDMGLGKTAQLLALLVHERARCPTASERPETSDRRSRLGPTSSSAQCPWSETGSTRPPASLRNWSSMSTMDRTDSPERRLPGTWVRWTWCSRPTASPRATSELLADVRWHRLVLDEAQQIKNSAARTTQSVRSIPAEQRIAMTGTPVENRLSELWSIMEFLNPGSSAPRGASGSASPIRSSARRTTRPR